MHKIARVVLGLVFLICASNLYAENGDLKVNGKLYVPNGALFIGGNTYTPSNMPVQHADGSDAAFFTRTTGSSGEMDFRLYLDDDANDKFSIWGNSCRGGCQDLSKSWELARFVSDGSTALGINGNVGIGTAGPAQKLQLGSGFIGIPANGAYTYVPASWQRGGGGIIIGSSSNPDGSGWAYGARQIVYDYGDGLNYEIDSLAGSWSNSSLVVSSRAGRLGYVGIGTTSPRSKLDIWSGAVSITGSSQNGTLVLDTVNGTSLIGTNTNSNGIAINPSGNVGIGTPSPQAKLDVNGNQNIGGNLLVGGMATIVGSPLPFGPFTLTIMGSAVAIGGMFVPSDVNLKENIVGIDSPLSKLSGIGGYSYNWKTKEHKDKGFPEGKRYGVLAQEVETVMPEIVKEGPDGEKTVAYMELIPLLIESIKEQQKIITKQNGDIEDLKALVNRVLGKSGGK